MPSGGAKGTPAGKPKATGPKPVTAAESIVIMSNLKSQAVAWFLGYRTLQVSWNLPQQADSTYNAAEAVRWLENSYKEKAQSQDANNADDALEYKRRLEAKKLEIQLLELEKLVVPTAMVQN
ncbi:MAG: hypothetical protein O3C60_06305, partial [Planctomycetota bacterium]|nr:hypothetical protein [Planctomycetota bacterium]